MAIAIAVGLAIVVAVFVGGFLSVPGLSSSNALNGNVEGCEAACANLVAKRAQTCSHRAAVASAQATNNAFAMQFAAAIAASFAASVLAVAAAAIPIVGPILAAAAAVASAAAAMYADWLFGKFSGASAALRIQLDGLAQAVTLEEEATALVTSSCPLATAERCIASLIPCPV
jgi:hypothetical protein